MLLMTLVAAGALSLEALPAQQKVLVGEPVRLTVVWKAQVPLEVSTGDQDGAFAFLSFFVDDGAGRKRYREHMLGRSERLELPVSLKAGGEAFQSIVLT